METKNDNMTLLLVLLLAQDKKLLQEIDPVLTFYEKHKDSFSLIQELLAQKKAQTPTDSADKPATPPPEHTPPMSKENPPMPEIKKSNPPYRELPLIRYGKN